MTLCWHFLSYSQVPMLQQMQICVNCPWSPSLLTFSFRLHWAYRVFQRAGRGRAKGGLLSLPSTEVRAPACQAALPLRIPCWRTGNCSLPLPLHRGLQLPTCAGPGILWSPLVFLCTSSGYSLECAIWFLSGLTNTPKSISRNLSQRK